MHSNNFIFLINKINTVMTKVINKVTLILFTMFFLPSNISSQCNDGVLITCGYIQTWPLNDNLTGGINNINSYNCTNGSGTYNGAEKKYIIDPVGESGAFNSIRISLEDIPIGSNFDLIVLVGGCDPNSCLISNNSSNNIDFVDIEWIGATTLIIVVEPKSTAGGNTFTINAYDFGTNNPADFCPLGLSQGNEILCNETKSGDIKIIQCLQVFPPVCVPNTTYYGNYTTLGPFFGQEDAYSYRITTGASSTNVELSGSQNIRGLVYATNYMFQDFGWIFMGEVYPGNIQSFNNENFNEYLIIVDGVDAGSDSYSLKVSDNLCSETGLCDNAPPMECGVFYTDDFQVNGSSFINKYFCNGGTEIATGFGNEVVYTFTPPETKEYTFYANSLTGNDPTIIITDCCNIGGEGGPELFILDPSINCSSDCFTSSDINGIATLTVTLSANVTYYIFYEQTIGSNNTFTRWIECENNICENALDVQCNTNYTNSFSDATIDVNIYYCTDAGNSNNFVRYENPNLIYKFTPTTSGVYTFNALSAFGTSPAIIISDCCDVSLTSEPTLQCGFVDCSFTNNNSITQNSATLVAGVEYYIFVENTNIIGNEQFVFWVNCDCNLFRPLANQMGNDIIFENNSPGTYVSHTIKFPYDESGQNFTYSDSLSQINGNGTISCHFPFPGCYEVCFYYRVNNQIRKCCFKYCPIIKKYDCDYPIIKEVSMTGNTSTINVECFFDGMPIRSNLQNLNICLVKVKPINGSNVTEYKCGTNITLPHGEYELCCWLFDPTCNSWQVCCKIICLPYIKPAVLVCGKENIQVEKISQTEYKYTWLGNPDGLEWTIMPQVNITTTGNMMNARYPGSGVYKVCGIGQTNMGTIILSDTCCVYTCIDDEPEIPCENSFRVIPLPNNRVRLVCTLGRPVLRWEVRKLDGLVIPKIYYGDSPIISLDLGFTYEIKKIFAGCCGVEEQCTKRFCYNDPFDCTHIMPRYLGGPVDLSLEYGFTIPDHLVGVEWRIDEMDFVIGTNTNNTSYVFPLPGCYTISVLIYDPINDCYVICCKRICITYPYDCSLLKHWFKGSESNPNVYSIELGNDCNEPMRLMSGIKWSINGIYYPEYDSMSSLNDIDLSQFGLPGTDIFICAMFYDPCLKACRWCYLKIRIEPPFNCNEFTPVFQSENQYTFTANGNYETTYWMVGGLEGLCYNVGSNNFDLSDPEIQNFITSQQLDYILVYFYYRVGFCWKVCCKKICLKGPDGCEEFGDGCDYFRPIYNEDFENVPPLGFGYMERDSININKDWWKGQGLVEGSKGKLIGNDILCLTLDNPFMDNVSVFKVTLDFEVEWFRNLQTAQYSPSFNGQIALCVNDAGGGIGICYTPNLSDILLENPTLLKFCGGGADIVGCSHKLEILIDRSGPVKMFIDGRKVNYTGLGGNNWENQGLLIDKINFASDGFSFDNICVAECKECLPPIVALGPFNPCNDIVFSGFGNSSDQSISGIFEYNGNNIGQGWIINLVEGDQSTTVFENFNFGPLVFPGFIPEKTYIVCFKYYDENGCLQYCCYKVNIPVACASFTPFFAGDEDPNNLTFRFDAEVSAEFGSPIAWFIGDERIGDNDLSVTYRFPSPGTYYIYCVYWDPISKCYVWCCRKICIDFPLNCNRIIIDYDGATNQYILSATEVEQIISWNIDIPSGLPNRGFIGMGNPQRFDPTDFGILPGQEIVISVRYIDADGCLKICCRRICLPVVTPVEECNNIFPIYTGNGLQYTFEVNPSEDFEDIIWRLHIPGTNQTIQIGTSAVSDVIDFEALTEQYPTLTLDKVCISIFYRDRATGCYKVCCKCFCIAQNPFDCNSIKYYYSGIPTNKLIYNLMLDVPGAQFINWTLDNTNTFLSDQSAFEVDFASLGVSLNDEIFVSVRYFDPVSECFRICCKRLCLGDPYSGCNKITYSLPVNNIISLSSTVNNPVWTIEGLPGIYSEAQNPTIDLNDPQIISLVQNNSTINVCVVYMENGCCRVCCTPVCVLPATVDCENFEINTTTVANNSTFNFLDSNTGAISTEITLPNGMLITLGGNITTYSNSLEGDYIICRKYLNGCEDIISCCQEFCLSFGLNCEPISFTINPTNDRIYTFSHNVIGGASYTWDFGDGTISNSDLTSIEHTYSSANQQYTVCLSVIDECGTECTQCVTISVGEINFNPIQVNPTCANLNNGSINLNITGGILPITIVWSPNESGGQISDLGAGSYSVTITEGNGRDTTLNFNLTAPLLPILAANVTHTTCGSDNGSITIVSTNNVGLVLFVWSPSGISTIGENANELPEGNYNVTVTDINGCETDLNNLVVNPSMDLAIFDFGNDRTLCFGDTITLDLGTLNAGNIAIEWYKDGNLISTNSKTLDISLSGVYHALLSNNSGCVRSDTIVINYYDDLIQLPSDETGLIYGETVTISVSGASSVEWNSTDVELSCTLCPSTSFEILNASAVFVSATDENNCIKSNIINFELDDMPIKGPNFFTPNNDGANDFLEFINLERFSLNSLTIFNRWGQILYKKEGYSNDWEGSINGNELPDGAYYYVLRYGNTSINQFEFKSDLTIIRNQ